MRKAGSLAALALVALASLALASGASAEKLRLKGKIVGQPQSKAQITVVRNKHKNLKSVLKVKFTRSTATCEDGSSGDDQRRRPAPFPISGKNFTRKTRVLGTGIDHGYFKAAGKFRRGGKAVKGRVRFAFKTTSGVGCGTGKVKWRAEA